MPIDAAGISNSALPPCNENARFAPTAQATCTTAAAELDAGPKGFGAALDWLLLLWAS
jgi:hypothetical protein